MENAKRLKTIKVSGGAEYAKVSERLKEFHKSYPEGSIETSYNATEQMLSFKALIIPDVTVPARFFTGHSLGKIAGVKAFEKLETIAVGRALAFLGLLADGDIASADEMEVYKEESIKIDNTNAIARLEKVKNIKELQKVWNGLTQKERDDKAVEEFKNKLKKSL